MWSTLGWNVHIYHSHLDVHPPVRVPVPFRFDWHASAALWVKASAASNGQLGVYGPTNQHHGVLSAQVIVRAHSRRYACKYCMHPRTEPGIFASRSLCRRLGGLLREASTVLGEDSADVNAAQPAGLSLAVRC